MCIRDSRYTEQALYYARSEHTEKDYFIRELRLFDAVHQSIGQNKYLLLQNGVTLQVHETEDTVFSDEKWLCFILNQLISNAVKYRRDPPVLTFRAVRDQDPPQTPPGWGSTSANACATSWTSASRPNPPQREPPFP